MARAKGGPTFHGSDEVLKLYMKAIEMDAKTVAMAMQQGLWPADGCPECDGTISMNNHEMDCPTKFPGRSKAPEQVEYVEALW